MERKRKSISIETVWVDIRDGRGASGLSDGGGRTASRLKTENIAGICVWVSCTL